MKTTRICSPQSGFSRIIIIGSMTALALAIVSLYYFVWRLSNSDYQAAITQVNSLKSSSDILTTKLSKIQSPGNIDDTVATDIQNAVNIYQKSAQDLDKSPVVSRDLRAKADYGTLKSTISTYGQSSMDLSTSIKLYVAILDSCTQVAEKLNQEDTDAFSTIYANCLDALDKGKASPSKSFNDQFFTQYRDETSIYIQSIVKFRTTDKAAYNTAKLVADKALEKITRLGSVKIDYSLSPPTDALGQLSTTLSSQKDTFLR